MAQSDMMVLAKARSRRHEEERGATLRIFSVKKNGEPYANPFHDGRRFTDEEARAEIARLLGLNPGRFFIAK